MGFGQNSLPDLLAERAALESEAGGVKGRIAQVNAKISELTKEHVALAFARAEKSDGTVKFAIGNRIYKGVIGKTVKWDSDALTAIAQELPFETVREIFKIDYSMSEAAFQAIDAPKLRAKLIAARTVKYGEAKITEDDK